MRPSGVTSQVCAGPIRHRCWTAHIFTYQGIVHIVEHSFGPMFHFGCEISAIWARISPKYLLVRPFHFQFKPNAIGSHLVANIFNYLVSGCQYNRLSVY